MIKTIVIAIMALTTQGIPVVAPEMNVAQAAVEAKTAETAPEAMAETTEQAEEVVVAEEDTAVMAAEETQAQEESFYSEPQEEMPTPADEFAYYDQSYLGAYTITWYAREEFGYDAPGASGLGCTPGYTCAVPEYWMLGHTVLIEGYGYRLATDISPDGIVDIYVASLSEIPSYGMDYANVYLVD